MKREKVNVDLQCPYCGCCKTLKTFTQRKAITCHMCQQSVFLSWATGKEGELDSKGFYYHAYEPFNLNKINDDFEDVFNEAKR